MIRITATVNLPEWWGADEAYEAGGQEAVLEVLHEDLLSFLDDAVWKVEKLVEHAGTWITREEADRISRDGP